MSDLIIISKKTKSRCFRYWLEMIKRINEEKKESMKISRLKFHFFGKKF